VALFAAVSAPQQSAQLEREAPDMPSLASPAKGAVAKGMDSAGALAPQVRPAEVHLQCLWEGS